MTTAMLVITVFTDDAVAVNTLFANKDQCDRMAARLNSLAPVVVNWGGPGGSTIAKSCRYQAVVIASD